MEINIDANKLMNTGAVLFVPYAHIDEVRASLSFNGVKLSELEQSDVLAGFLGWFDPTAQSNSPVINPEVAPKKAAPAPTPTAAKKD